MLKIVVPVFFIFLISCENGFRTPKFSIIAPVDWTRSDTIAADGGKWVRLYSPLEDSADEFKDNIFVIITRGKDVDNLIKTSLTGIHKRSIYFAKEKFGETKINGMDAKWLSYSVQYKSSAFVVEQKIYYIPYKGYIFRFICTSDGGQFAKFQPKVNEVLGTFKII